MRSLYVIMSLVVVLGLAVWAYRENYRTQEVLREVSHMQRTIGQQREELAVLKAEWAYLNRPERLRDLAALNFDRLGLMPFAPEQFGRIEQVAFPSDDEMLLFEIVNAVDVAGALASEEED